jgi:plasmid stabilization system protein ParE
VATVPPLTLAVTRRAQERLREATDWLFGLSEDAADRFNAAIQSELPTLCQSVAEQIATGRPPIPDEAASLAFSRPVHMHLITTSKRRRRSASGAWRIYFDLQDANGDGTPDTLRVLTIRHAAARPIWDVDAAASGGDEGEEGDV